jgi:hypothetical protein
MDHAAILTEILRRNALRRDTRLPPLDVRAEYQQAVATAHWREVRDRHYETVREEVVQRLRQERGPNWGHSAGGRWMVEALTERELQRFFPLPARYRPGSAEMACR